MSSFIVKEKSSDSTPVFSVVICSIDAEKYKCCRENIATTIGVPVEFICVKNREAKYPIAKAYNCGAEVATAPNLLFIHEDILFENSGWGIDISEKLLDPSTGVIGFIGIPFRYGSISGWSEDSEYALGHIYYIKDGFRYGWHREPWDYNNGSGGSFAQVLVVDGLGFAVSRDVWMSEPFDETLLEGFHCYDIDFCLQIGLSYKNYVYLKADITHFSNGNYDRNWLDATIKLTDGKWSKILPMSVGGYKLVNPEKFMARSDYRQTRRAIRGRATRSQAIYLVKRFIKKSIRSKYYLRRLPTVLYQFIIKYYTLPSSL